MEPKYVCKYPHCDRCHCHGCFSSDNTFKSYCSSHMILDLYLIALEFLTLYSMNSAEKNEVDLMKYIRYLILQEEIKIFQKSDKYY